MNEPTTPFSDAHVQWFDAAQGMPEGKAWTDTDRFYDRLPARAKAVVTEKVWDRSRQPAGMAVRFIAETPEIWVRWEMLLERPSYSYTHPVEHSGVDLYGRDTDGQWKWIRAGDPYDWPVCTKRLTKQMDPVRREYLLYLPLRNAVRSVYLGVPRGCHYQQMPPRPQAPLVVYGTSICHGVGASRPGMAHPMITARQLDLPLHNLGFGGCAQMELPIADLLGELEACVYVVDALPNMGPQMVTQRARPFIERLRSHRPDTPIVIVEGRVFTDAWTDTQRLRMDHAKNEALQAAYRELLDAGVPHLHYVPATHLLGDDHEGTIDGSHPTDLGMMRQALIMTQTLGPLVGAQGAVAAR